MVPPDVTRGAYPERLIRVRIARKGEPEPAVERVFLPGADIVLGAAGKASLLVPGWTGPSFLLIARGTHLHLGPGMRLAMSDEAGGHPVAGELEELQRGGMTFPLEIPASQLNVRLTEAVSVFVQLTEVIRRAARLVVQDEVGRMVLLQYARPNGDTYWATPGGGLEEGESFEAAALREAAEELGVRATEVQPLWEGATTLPTEAGRIGQREWFFLLRVAGDEVGIDVEEAQRREGIIRKRWWTLAELESTSEVVFPENLALAVRSSTPRAGEDASPRALPDGAPFPRGIPGSARTR